MLFINRCNCPICNSKSQKTLLSLPYSDERFQAFLQIERTYFVEFWEDYHKFNLINEIYTIVQCIECGFIYQSRILNEEGMQLLYSKWINKNKLNKIRQETNTLKLHNIFKNIIKFGLVYNNSKCTIKVLDWGAGTGELCQILLGMGLDVYAIEYAQEREKELQNNNIKTITPEKINSNCFDFIIINQVLEHVAEPLKLLIEANRALKGDGTLYLSTPTCTSIRSLILKERLNPAFFSQLSPHQHINAFTNKSLKSICKRAGFKPLIMPTDLFTFLYYHNFNAINISLLSLVYNHFFKTSIFYRKFHKS